jgi:kumamolisin
MPIPRVALRGSERRIPPDAQIAGVPDSNDRTTVTIMLRRRKAKLPAPGSAVLMREQFAKRYGADEADVALVEQFAAEHDLTVTEVSLPRRSVQLAGTVANFNEAFATRLVLYLTPAGTFRGREGALFLPQNLEEVVTGVFGLDERPQARAHFRRHFIIPGIRATGDTSYAPPAVAKLYSYPKATGAGQTVAIIELGGGYAAADLNSYFSGLGIKPAPVVSSVGVDGAQNQPTGDPNGPDGEVLLDIEVVGAIAPGAKIVVYFAPNTDQGFLDAITTAIHDTVRKPSVISISWGGPESSWTAQALQNFDAAFQDAALLGVSVCCASGDDGSSDGATDGAAHVDFPSSSPNVLACGGTRLESSGGKVTREVVWNHGPGNGATGGGVSETFPLPSYQTGARVPVSVNPNHFAGRGVPDVSGDADPATGYQIHVDNRDAVFGGTSAVAPLWAALIALINQQSGAHAGFLNPKLYSAGKAFRDITSGDNGAYQAGPGWDPCTGLGSPDGTAVAGLFGAKSRK